MAADPASDGDGPDGSDERTAFHRELRRRIGWLVRLRWGAAAGLVAVAGAAGRMTAVDQRPLWASAVVLVALNGGYQLIDRYRNRRAEQVTQTADGRFANLQIVADLVLLAVIVFATGGTASPFAGFFVFHMVIASILLSNRAALLQATAATLLLVAGLAVRRLLGLPAAEPGPFGLVAMTAGLVFALYATVYLSTRIVNAWRERDQRLFETNARLAEHDRATSQYVMTVAHDVNGSLAAIISSLRVVLDGLTGELTARARDMVSRAERRSRNLQRFARDLLAISRLRVVSDEIAEPADLADATASAVAELQPLAAERQVLLRNADVANPLLVGASRQELDHIVANLVTNAVRYTEAAGRVTVSADRSKGDARLVVADTGIGIDPDDLPHIFDDFYRSAAATRMDGGGTGLGLAIVNHIVKRRGGRVDVASRAGEGTTVTVLLPLHERPPGR